MDKYYIVDRSILPDVVEKVIEARTLLENGKVKQVSEAVKQVGISRGTYYKYKDVVFRPETHLPSRKAVLTLMLHHDRGILSEVLAVLSAANASVLTINQNIPIHDWASVVISVEISELNVSLDDVIAQLRESRGVSDVRLLAVE
ncbi:ACT domain-containing protein [Lacticaseibacillus saniviri]|nr:ACT domain-containing protein [Lacticaseibacillus saniviri]MCG4282643.1 ACT domain-containing protein [Lacticaseibacillus saniviri]